MANKKGPLGTPLGNPLKFFREQKESRLAKADSGMGIMKHHLRNMAAEDAYNKKVMDYFETQPPIDAMQSIGSASGLAPGVLGRPAGNVNPGGTTPGDLRHLDKFTKRP